MSKKSIANAYANPRNPGGLSGLKRFAQANQKSLKEVREALQKDLAYTLHKPVRSRFPTLKVVVFGIDHQWVADLVDMQRLSRYNQGFKYLLTIVDVLSKYARVEPLKDKTGASLVRAFAAVLKRANSRSPRQLQTNKGKEFYYALFSKWLKHKGIRHFSTQGDAKAGLVARFNCTLKGRMYRYFTAANTLKYMDVVQDLVEGYNGTPHRSIGMAPRDVTPENEDKVWMKLYGGKHKLKKPAFATGDRVRMAQKTRPFKKGYLPGWTEEVFVVV